MEFYEKSVSRKMVSDEKKIACSKALYYYFDLKDNNICSYEMQAAAYFLDKVLVSKAVNAIKRSDEKDEVIYCEFVNDNYTLQKAFTNNIGKMYFEVFYATNVPGTMGKVIPYMLHILVYPKTEDEVNLRLLFDEITKGYNEGKYIDKEIISFCKTFARITSFVDIINHPHEIAMGLLKDEYQRGAFVKTNLFDNISSLPKLEL